MNRSPRRWVWPAFLVLALLFLGTGNGALYGVAVPVAALASRSRCREPVRIRGTCPTARTWPSSAGSTWAWSPCSPSRSGSSPRTAWPASSWRSRPACCWAWLAPLSTVWVRHRPLSDLGLTRSNLRAAVALGLVLGAVQFAMTLWGYALPQPVDWVPLLVLSLTVGFFEAVFFRGFIQTRLASSYGPIAGVGGASALYALYHVGYGMGPAEMLFLFGLGVVYGVAFATVRNIAVLWPLLIPLGSFYNNLQSSDIRMPWAAILGFADVLGLMAMAVWLAARHHRRETARTAGGQPHATKVSTQDPGLTPRSRRGRPGAAAGTRRGAPPYSVRGRAPPGWPRRGFAPRVSEPSAGQLPGVAPESPGRETQQAPTPPHSLNQSKAGRLLRPRA